MNMEKQAAAGQGRWAMMRKIQEVGLTLVDLTEYLDTHVNDAFAVERHHEAAEVYQQLVEEYESYYGPLTLGGEGCEASRWQWAVQDFPWDYEL